MIGLQLRTYDIFLSKWPALLLKTISPFEIERTQLFSSFGEPLVFAPTSLCFKDSQNRKVIDYVELYSEINECYKHQRIYTM